MNIRKGATFGSGYEAHEVSIIWRKSARLLVGIVPQATLFMELVESGVLHRLTFFPLF